VTGLDTEPPLFAAVVAEWSRRPRPSYFLAGTSLAQLLPRAKSETGAARRCAALRHAARHTQFRTLRCMSVDSHKRFTLRKSSPPSQLLSKLTRRRMVLGEGWHRQPGASAPTQSWAAGRNSRRGFFCGQREARLNWSVGCLDETRRPRRAIATPRFRGPAGIWWGILPEAGLRVV